MYYIHWHVQCDHDYIIFSPFQQHWAGKFSILPVSEGRQPRNSCVLAEVIEFYYQDVHFTVPSSHGKGGICNSQTAGK